MEYIAQLPNGALSKYIDKFWYCSADEFSNVTLVAPLLHHELVFNFSDLHNISLTSDTGTIVLQNQQSWIAGIQTRPTITKCSGMHEMIGVLFKPNGIKAFTKFHAADFADNFIDATLIFGNTFPGLIEKLRNEQKTEKKFLFLEDFLKSKLQADVSPAYLTASLDLFASQVAQKLSIKEISKQISVSNKSLINAFQKHIGVLPGKYSNLVLVNRAIQLLSNDPKQSLTKLAYELNYYDQSHFISVFKSVTSLTPTQFNNLILKGKSDPTSANFILLQG